MATTALMYRSVITPMEKIKYVLYARKSAESEERQILSIGSQIKEMLQKAEKENLRLQTSGANHIRPRIQVRD